MMRAKHKVWQNALVIVALSCTGGASEAADPLLSSIVGIYDGEIESNTMVQISTEFYFDAPSSGGGLTSQGTSSSVEIVGVFGAAGKGEGQGARSDQSPRGREPGRFVDQALRRSHHVEAREQPWLPRRRRPSQPSTQAVRISRSD